MSSRRKGRPVIGAVSGLIFGLFVGIDLWLLGRVRLDSPLLGVLPVACLVLGLGLGLWAPFGRRADAGAGTDGAVS